MEIKVDKLNHDELKKMGVFGWPVWEKEVSKFDWHYNDTEECYLLEGQVTVKTQSGDSVDLGVGDFVNFPKGLSCTWDITKPVKKHYNFK